jgi:predicted ArsR family transcriptional regulator
MKALLHTVSRRRGATLEEIAGITGISYTTILQTAAMLETDGYIRIDLMQRCTLENMKR